MKKIVVYVHGKGGSPTEADLFRPLFPDCDVVGFDYRSDTPWNAKNEFFAYFEPLKKQYDSVTLIANSIGACFSMYALSGRQIDRAFFISPVVDLKSLIESMMLWANVSKEDLQARGTIPTPFGETLSWAYYTYVCGHPTAWDVPTEILYGDRDCLIDRCTVTAFAEAHRAGLTVMEDGEHWFHTVDQICFLKDWICKKSERKA